MKKIETIIRKSRFADVKKALHDVEVNFFSYWDVTGVGNEKVGHVYRGVTYSTADIQRRFLSIVVSEPFVEKTINAILESAYTFSKKDFSLLSGDGIKLSFSFICSKKIR